MEMRSSEGEENNNYTNHLSKTFNGLFHTKKKKLTREKIVRSRRHKIYSFFVKFYGQEKNFRPMVPKIPSSHRIFV